MTNKQIESMSDKEFAAMILAERLDKATNPYSVKSQKLRSAINTLRHEAAREKQTPKNWWMMRYTDDEAMSRSPQTIPLGELQRIAGMVARGFTAGELHMEGWSEDEV